MSVGSVLTFGEVFRGSFEWFRRALSITGVLSQSPLVRSYNLITKTICVKLSPVVKKKKTGLLEGPVNQYMKMSLSVDILFDFLLLLLVFNNPEYFATRNSPSKLFEDTLTIFFLEDFLITFAVIEFTSVFPGIS